MILTSEQAKLYYKLHWALLAHTSRRLNVIPAAATIDDILALSTPEKKLELCKALYENPDVMVSFIAENPDGFSPDELAIVASWRHHISGEFYIFRYLKRYTVFLSAAKPERLYGVHSLRDPIEDIFAGRPLPIYVKAVLLPFEDKIIYDGLLSTYSVRFGGGIRSNLKETYNRIKRRKGIVERLVGADGEAQVWTSLDRRAPRKPPPDWKPVVDEIVTQAEKIRRTDTLAQGAAVSLLRAAARVSQTTLRLPDATKSHLKQLGSVRRALTKLENILRDDLVEM